jgi:ribosomal protein S14
VTTEVTAPHERASLAAKQALARRIASLGAVPLRAAAAARGIDPDSAGVWAKRGLSRSTFRGPRGAWCVREAEFDAELPAWRCKWDGCERYALLSATGRCREHSGCAESDGRLTAEELAAKYSLNLAYLLKRLDAGEIPGQRVDRQGRAVERDRFHATWRITEQNALQALDELRCKTDGCDRYALAPTGYCAACTTARMQAARWRDSPGKIRKVCTECGSERTVYPSLQRSGGLCVRCSIAAEDRETTAALIDEGLVPIKLAARLLYRSPAGLRSAVTLERRQLGRRAYGRLGVNARDVLRLSPHKDARRKLSKPLAVLNGTERFGGVSVLTEAEQELIVSLRVADPVAWSWRKLADRLNVGRPARGEKPVSFMAVKRAFERAMRPGIAL